jgi:hypothetical protein
MSYYPLYLIALHLIEESSRYRYERAIASRSSGKRVGLCRLIVSDLWHRDRLFPSNTLDSRPYYLELRILTRRLSIEEYYRVGSLGTPSRYKK